MKKTKTKKEDDKLVDKILDKIRTGGDKEEPATVEQIVVLKTISPKKLKELRTKSIKPQRPKQVLRSREDSGKALLFVNTMTMEEEKIFDQMMDIFSLSTENERIDGLIDFLKKNALPQNLLLNLKYFPHLEKYYLLADAEIRKPKKGRHQRKMLNKGYFKFLPKPAGNKKKRLSKEDYTRKKKMERQIAREFYLDVSDTSKEEMRAIDSLLEVSERFRELYDEYKKN